MLLLRRAAKSRVIRDEGNIDRRLSVALQPSIATLECKMLCQTIVYYVYLVLGVYRQRDDQGTRWKAELQPRRLE